MDLPTAHRVLDRLRRWESTETVYPNGSTAETTTYTYDYDGDLIAVTDGLSHTTSYAYDAMGDLISETDPTGGGTTTYGYDLAGRLTSLTDPDNNITSWTYTHADEVATEVNPLGFATTYVYDLVGNVTSVTDPNSHTITYSYDADNEETGETWVNPMGGSALNLVTITYDADGDTTQVHDANANYQYTYNADDEVSTFADNGTTGLPLVTLTYGYDGDGNETSVTDSQGGLLTLTYDARDELTNEQFSGTGLSAEAVTYAYDNAGRLTGLTRYSNLAETTEVAATAYSYDHADRMTGIVDSNSTGTTLITYGYTYDAADRVSQETRTWASGASSDTLTYSYTNNNQLTGVSHTNGSFSNESFTWDSNGNETGTGYTTGTDNEQTASPGYTYTYDNAGEMTSETQTSTGDVWTYGYDFRGRMVTAVEKTSGGSTLESVTYTYDALDNRIGMDENGTQTWTLYDGGTPIMDFSQSGALTTRYMSGAEPCGQCNGIIGAILSIQTSAGATSWFLPDEQGTARDLVNASGNIVDHVDFSAFGTVLDETNPSNGDRMMGFEGMERDTAAGLELADYREENPGTGRWLSQDPMGFAAGDVNLERYAFNEPTSLSDATGLYATVAWWSVGRVLPLAGGAAVADGPIPIGDAVAIGIIGAAAIYDIYLWAAGSTTVYVSRGNIENEIVRDIKRRLVREPKGDVCEWLDAMYTAARAAGDSALAEKIKTAQKHFRCRKSRDSKDRSPRGEKRHLGCPLNMGSSTEHSVN
jgi:RHS repeat-associated protein